MRPFKPFNRFAHIRSRFKTFKSFNRFAPFKSFTGLRKGGTCTFREFSKRQNDREILLLWIWDTELATNLAREKIGNLSMSWNRRDAAGIGKIDVFAMFSPFVSENASEPLQVSNELSPLHLHLKLFDHYLVFG
jgi:hypothetical protein